MKLSPKCENIYKQISKEDCKLGDLRKVAKDVKKDHKLALELWKTGDFMARQLSILIMDNKEVDLDFVDYISNDIKEHKYNERNQLTDWFMANQLLKNKRLIKFIETWEKSKSVIKRRIYWYYQARLRWTGKTDFTNTEKLLDSIETEILNEEEEVQWAMNFTAGQIGKWEAKYRERCIKLGEDTGLYSNEVAPKGCTPNYLPEFIRIEVAKMNN